MKLQGRASEAARAQMAPAIVAFARRFDANADEKVAIEMLRSACNWLRHHDRGDSDSIEVDLRVEAVVIVERAIENRYGVDRTEHPRVREVVALSREA
jgi:hypothetical protein